MTDISFESTDKADIEERKKAAFSDYQIEETIRSALNALGYTEPTEIQSHVIPAVLEGRDIIAKSKTGSGKTAAFAIPVCSSISWEENKAQVLVLEPTRELAFQVKDEMYAIGRMKRLKVPVLYGGFSMEKQVLSLKQKSHIVVGTPGRVLDHCEKATLDLSNIKYVVIDEADLMLDMGFIEDVRKILKHLDTKPVFMLFSATMGERLEQLSSEFMTDPLEIKIENDTETADSIEQIGYYVQDEERKLPLFLDILTMENPENAMIFCGTREMVEVLYYQLKKEKIACGMLHGMIDQKVRTRTIEDFRTQGFRILIATDVAARGVDFQGITHVFNYDLPTNKEVYVHRIGRTGRAGKSGRAVSLIRDEERKMLAAIEKFTGVNVTIKDAPNANDVEEMKEAFLKRQRQKRPRKKKKQDVFGEQLMCLTIGGGKKSKIRSGDIVGAVSSIEGIDGKSDIGAIDIRESITYVEILNGKGNLVLEELPKRTLKGKYRKVQQTRDRITTVK